MWNYIKRCMLQHPQARLYDDQESISFSRLVSYVEKKARELPSVTKCAILCRRPIQTAKAVLLCFEAGITAIPMPVTYGAENCRRIFKKTGFNMLITDDLGMLSLLPGYKGGVYLLGTGLTHGPVFADMDDELTDVSVILSTSGTTGSPKCAMITGASLLANLLDIFSYFKPERPGKICICRPIYHSAVLTGEFLFSLLYGLDVYFYNKPFEPRTLLHTLVDQQITVLCATPTLFYHMCDYARKKHLELPLQTVAVSGECMTELTAERMREALPNTQIYHVYGMTEASPRIAYLPPEKFFAHPTSVGVPLDSLSIKIVGPIAHDDSGNASDGLIYVFGPNVMKGYYRDPVATDRAIQGGWLCTGDIGCVDSNGLLYIKGRADHMLIRAGCNIYPQEIENALIKHAAIQDVLVEGELSPSGGNRIIAKVCPSDPATTEAQLYSLCRQLLPPHCMPDKIFVVREIAYNQSGKKIRKDVKNA